MRMNKTNRKTTTTHYHIHRHIDRHANNKIGRMPKNWIGQKMNEVHTDKVENQLEKAKLIANNDEKAFHCTL